MKIIKIIRRNSLFYIYIYIITNYKTFIKNYSKYLISNNNN